MATIMFTWEIGEASGHIAPYINLIKALEAGGHTIYFAVKELKKAHLLFKDTNVIYLQAPTLNANPSDLLYPVDSYPKILNNSGYARPVELAGLIRAWRNLYDLAKPDLLIFDYSPTAMLAARNLPIKRLQIGTGFFTPPATYPITGLGQLQGEPQNQDDLLDFENAMLDKINEALTLNNIPQISKMAEIQQADNSLLFSFRELEHYPARQNGNYLGIFKAPKGLAPEWPAAPGAKVFMYLKPFPTLPALLQALNQKRLPTLIYPDGISDKLKQKFTSDTLHFVDKPLDMDTIGKTADVAVCNANHGTVCELLLSGIPILLLPLHAEQNICALNVQKIGAGLSAPQKHPVAMVKKLEALIHDPRYRNAAKEFSARYRDFNETSATDAVMASINHLLNKQIH